MSLIGHISAFFLYYGEKNTHNIILTEYTTIVQMQCIEQGLIKILDII